MTNSVHALWNDDKGFIVSAELMIIATIGVLAMVVGLTAVSHSVNQELEDVASAFGSVNQSYWYECQHSHHAGVEGADFTDTPDFCDNEDLVSSGSNGEGY